MDNEFSVLEMAQAYAAENNMDADDLFKQPPKQSDKKDDEDVELEETITMDESPVQMELVEDVDGFQPVTYHRDEIISDDMMGTIINGAEEELTQNATQLMDDLTRKEYNIDLAKARWGIAKLQIPEGKFHFAILNAASDPDPQTSREALDEIFGEIVNIHPEFILERTSDQIQTDSEVPNNTGEIIDIPAQDIIPVTEDSDTSVAKEKTEEPVTKVTIDKRDAPALTWTPEELEKVRKSRIVELNIVEDVTLRYNNITNIDTDNENVVDKVLSQYTRKVNDVAAPLPASKYRATFTGLTYMEALDLSYSTDLNDLEGLKKRWSIAFDHIKNPSIGPWEERYIDIGDGQTKHISKFEDFLQKTSWVDLEFILWKILCATSMDEELITINCNGRKSDGSVCGKSYDWIYSPHDILQADSMDPAVLEEMSKTATVMSLDDIHQNYMGSMLKTDNTVELPTSKYGIIFGHISAYDYLESVYSELQEVLSNQNSYPSDIYAHTAITAIKAFLLPMEDGGWGRISDPKNLIRVISSLDEYDCQTITRIVELMINPYKLEFQIKDVHCANCNQKSHVPIEDMSRLLFHLVQSLSSVQVTFKKS